MRSINNKDDGQVKDVIDLAVEHERQRIISILENEMTKYNSEPQIKVVRENIRAISKTQEASHGQ